MILISGATGNVGKELVGHLLAKDERIRVLVRDKHKAALRGDRVEMAVGDLDRPDTLQVAHICSLVPRACRGFPGGLKHHP